MGFGFVVVKFSLFVRQITLALADKAVNNSPGYSHNIGIFMVALGGLTIVAAYIRYNNTRKQLDTGSFHHTTLFIKITTIVMLLASVILLAYLMTTA